MGQVTNLAKLNQSRNDREREEEVNVAKTLREQFPKDYPTWGSAIAAAADYIRRRRGF